MPKSKQTRLNPTRLNQKRVSAPVATSLNIGTNRKSVVVSHSESFALANAVSTDVQVLATSISEVYGWTVQPGYGAMFPWLSRVAANYEKYRFRKLDFEFRTWIGTSTPGIICLSMDLDPDDPVPVGDDEGRRQVMNQPVTQSGASWSTSLVLSIPRKVLETVGERFTRTGMEAGTVEPRTADAGLFLLGLFGVPPDTTLGEIYVHYEVELIAPQYRLNGQDSLSEIRMVYETDADEETDPQFPITPLADVDVTGYAYAGPLVNGAGAAAHNPITITVADSSAPGVLADNYGLCPLTAETDGEPITFGTSMAFDVKSANPMTGAQWSILDSSCEFGWVIGQSRNLSSVTTPPIFKKAPFRVMKHTAASDASSTATITTELVDITLKAGEMAVPWFKGIEAAAQLVKAGSVLISLIGRGMRAVGYGVNSHDQRMVSGSVTHLMPLPSRSRKEKLVRKGK